MSERLWAPWRMEYIEGHRRSACIFCDFASEPASKYREDFVLVVQEHALVSLNRYPFTTSHLLVAPRRHVADLGELSDVEYAAFMDLVRKSAARLRTAVNAQALNIGLNLGAAAGAGIADHLHGHIVPRWQGDANFMPVIADVRIMPQYLDEAWARLYPAFADLPGARAAAP